jgi:hypothetical protein
MADMIVTGTEVDGTFAESGTFNGLPYYQCAANLAELVYQTSGGLGWSIYNSSAVLLYHSGTAEATPDLVGSWMTDAGSGSPSVTTGGGAVAPTVTTGVVFPISFNTATGAGNVTSDGGAAITERGIVVNTTGNPTTADPLKSTSAGTTGVYTTSITGLTPGRFYYVRAYAINSAGTSYGSEVTFTASPYPKTFTVRYGAATRAANY